MSYQNIAFDLSHYLDSIIFGTDNSPSPTGSDPELKKLLEQISYRYLEELIEAGREASCREAGSGINKRKLITVEGIHQAVAHDREAYTRVREIGRVRKEMKRTLEVAGGIVEIEEEEGEGGHVGEEEGHEKTGQGRLAGEK